MTGFMRLRVGRGLKRCRRSARGQQRGRSSEEKRCWRYRTRSPHPRRARRKLTGIAVAETAGCKIVMVVFGRLGGRRWFARGGARCRAKTKRMLADQVRQVTFSGSGIPVKRGMQRRRDELQAKRKDGKTQPEVTRAASSPAYSPVSPTPCLQTGLVLSAAPMEGSLSRFLRRNRRPMQIYRSRMHRRQRDGYGAMRGPRAREKPA